MTMPGAILTLNAGSSSLKFAVFQAAAEPGDDLAVRVRGEIEDLDTIPSILAKDGAGVVLADGHWRVDAGAHTHAVLDRLLAFVDDHLGGNHLAAIGHRVVHGGERHVAPERVTQALLSALQALIPLDPLHMPDNLAPIRALAESRPALPQVACFDTAFHHTLPPVARGFALPRAMSDGGVRRYGFHGLSYEYIAGRLAQRGLPRRVVVAHLGAGASLCALLDGASIATTFGFSTLDGLMMATRCGSIDPGIILYLGRQGRSFSEIETLLYHQSGLLGVSGISGDVRVLLASDDPHAAEAIDLFTYRIAAEAATMACALGGLDMLVFTGGIGEHAPAIRAAVCARLAWLGLALDAGANDANVTRISTAASGVEILVIPTDEEQMIARHTAALVI